MFNTKNRHCEVYRAKEGTKLSINGSRIVNFDDAISIGKTIRKPAQDLVHWISASSVRRLEILSNDINGKKWQVSGKINKNCMIIKIL